MSLSIGIVGLPNVGKSTLFNALTKSNILAANYPFATIEPNTGIVPVPDERLEKLEELYKPQKTIPATVTFVDIAGLVAGASKGEGLGNQFLANIRECNAIAHVVRAFHDPNVQHVSALVNPQDDIDVITTELVLADLQSIDKQLPRVEKESRANPKLAGNLKIMQDIKALLDKNTPIYHSAIIKNLHEDEKKFVSSLQLITSKPVIYVFNVDEATLIDAHEQATLKALCGDSPAVFVNAKLESELSELSQEDQDELLSSYGVSESGLSQLARVGYEYLGLQSYLTAGEKEVRAWTIPKGATAPQAAGVIHGDFERGFIAASIVSFQDLIACGSEASAKAAGKMRTEGKSYIMQDGDVVEFKFNV